MNVSNELGAISSEIAALARQLQEMELPLRAEAVRYTAVLKLKQVSAELDLESHRWQTR